MSAQATGGYSEAFAEEVSSCRRIKDPIHGYIPVSSELIQYIDTPEFQRLRNVKQLGTSYYVWLGAAHNRFEHCLGVAYLCGRIVATLQTAQPGLGITERDKFCVELAGLCHDLGHGPFSHVFDSQFMPAALKAKGSNAKWEHEEGSELMFDALIASNDISISEEDRNFVKDLIRGERRLSNVPPEKMFLFEIVANKHNGIDVDKLDYIARDSWATEDQLNKSALRLIDSARVLDGHICFSIKDANSVYHLFHTRFSLHKRIYNHKTSRAIEYMIVDALLAAESVLRISDRVYNPDKFRYLTDSITTEIEQSDDPALDESKAILYRIRKRNLYRTVDFCCLPWSYGADATWKAQVTREEIVRRAKEECAVNGDQEIRAKGEELVDEHVIVDWAPVHWGMKEKNPIDNVGFYGKYTNPPKPMKATKQDVTHLLPSSFAEYHLRVYTRESKFFGIVQAGFRKLLKELPQPPEHLDALHLSNDDDKTVPEPDEVQVPDEQKTPRATPMRTPPQSREGSFIIPHSYAYGTTPSTPRHKKLKASPQDGQQSVEGSKFFSTPIYFNSHPEMPPSPTRKPQKVAVQAPSSTRSNSGKGGGDEGSVTSLAADISAASTSGSAERTLKRAWDSDIAAAGGSDRSAKRARDAVDPAAPALAPARRSARKAQAG